MLDKLETLSGHNAAIYNVKLVVKVLRELLEASMVEDPRHHIAVTIAQAEEASAETREEDSAEEAKKAAEARLARERQGLEKIALKRGKMSFKFENDKL